MSAAPKATPKTPDDHLSVGRRLDRIEMARRLAAVCRTYNVPCEVTPHDMKSMRRRVDVRVKHASGLTGRVSFDGDSANGDTYLIHWYDCPKGYRLNPAVFASVNPFHFHKATDIADGFEQLLHVWEIRCVAISEGYAMVAE